MPSGATLPFVTYKDTGIQSITSTLTPLPDENVVSTFLSMPSRSYLYGSNDVVIEGEIDIETTNGLATGTNVLDSTLPDFQTFRVPDDADAISNISFSYEFDIESTSTAYISKSLGFELIKKVEVRVGNQIWQTLTGEDIFARNISENNFLSPDEMWDTVTSIKGSNLTESYTEQIDGVYAFKSGKYNLSGTIDLKIFSGSGDKLNSFIQYGAPNNDIVLKIFYNKPQTLISFVDIVDSINLKNPKLTIKKYNFSQTEKDYINDNVLNNVVNTSQNIGVRFKPTISGSTFTEKTFSININDFSIQTSHILITPVVTPYGDVVGNNSFAGVTSTGHGIYTRGFGTPHASSVKPGIFDFIKTAELFINGSSVTGKLPSSYLKTNAKRFLKLNSIREFPIYCIPLASEKFGLDSLVMSKLSNKKLILTFDEHLVGSVINDVTLLNITAVGTNVVTYVGGECSQQIAN